MSENKAVYNMKSKFAGLRIFNDTVIVRPFVKHEEIGGILLPATAQESATKSEGICVGPGWIKDLETGKREPMRVKVGDMVFHSQYAGSETNIKFKTYFGEKILVMHETDVFGIYKSESLIDLELFDNRVFLEWEEAKEIHEGTKLLRAPSMMERHYTGTVLSVGPKVWDVKVGMRVFFDQFCSPKKVDYMSKRYALVKEYDVYCECPERVKLEVLSQ